MIALAEKTIKIDDVVVEVIASRPGQMYGWPGICRAANGNILVAASERRYHCCPFGREVIMRSSDNGQTWSLPQEVYNSELDDRDANLLALPDGTIILSWFTSTAFETRWTERASRVTESMRRDLLGTWMVRSSDNGHIWEELPTKIPVGVHISPVLLSDGSLLSIGPETIDGKPVVGVYKSENNGQDWHRVSEITSQVANGQVFLNENHAIEVAPGKLVIMFRSDPVGDGCLYQAFSDNYGENWTVPQKTGIWGYPPHLLKLSDGTVMCSYSYRRDKFSIRTVFSYDNCRSWDTDNIITLYEWEDQPDMGYPSSIELAPGEVMTVFYCSRRDKWTPGMGEVSSEGLLAVRFKLLYS
jgi:hypothetical protein